jgi:putative chitinase
MSVKGQGLQLKCLYGFIPNGVLDKLPEIMETYKIDTRNKLAHFLGQLIVESGFQAKSENLNYSAKGLKRVFRKYFKNDADINAYAGKPEKIGNRVYANRLGNGNEASGEGFKFRGHGFIQLTGKSNISEFAKFIGDNEIIENPELLNAKYPLESSAWYFMTRSMKYADTPLVSSNIRKVTRTINGKLLHFEQRKKWTQKFGSIIDCTYSAKDYYKREKKQNYQGRKEFK